jgi:beta-1,4-mannosyltransferase
MQASELTFKNVALATLWLSPEDYPKWLACVDLGVSLHTSTSGRDLPIKILDYFGCEIPVIAYNFGCLYELVQHDVNGRVFTTSTELADSLWELLSPLALAGTGPDTSTSAEEDSSGSSSVTNHDFGDLKRYSLQVQGKLLWSTNWTKHAWPVMENAVRDYRTLYSDRAAKKE